MNSPEFLTEIRKQAVRSAGQNNINATKMRNMEVPVAGLAERARLLTDIETHAARRRSRSHPGRRPGEKRRILLDGILAKV